MQIKAHEPEVELLELNGTLRPYWKVLENIVPENQICKIIELLETVLLKYQMLKSNSNKYEKYQQNCQMWSVSGASTVYDKLGSKHSIQLKLSCF